MSGVTIMILIILLIAILMSYVLYCDPDTSPDLASLGENMVTNLISPSVILTESERIKSPRPLQVESNKYRFLLNIQEEEARNLQNLCHAEYLQPPGLDCVGRIPRIVVSTVSPEPCPSDTSDTTCTSIQSDSSQSSAASAASWTSSGVRQLSESENRENGGHASVFLTHLIVLELL